MLAREKMMVETRGMGLNDVAKKKTGLKWGVRKKNGGCQPHPSLKEG